MAENNKESKDAVKILEEDSNVVDVIGDAGTVPKPVVDLTGDGGVLKQILEASPETSKPTAGCKVSLHYTGTLLDGTKFDSSLDRNEPFEFELNKGVVIKAFDLGIATMSKGEKAILTCAPEYAYGASGSGPNIPPNATLLFEVCFSVFI